MSRRDLIRMTDEEIDGFLHERQTMNVATFNHDGTALYAGGQVNENDGFGGMLDGHGMAPSTRT